MADPAGSGLGDAYIQLGNSYHMENRVDSALHYFNKALEQFRRIANEQGIVKRTQGDLAGSIEDSRKSLEIYKKIKWQIGIVNTYNNIAGPYNHLKKHDEALKYARAAFSESRLLNDSLKYFNVMSEYGSELVFAGKTDSVIYYINKARPYLERNHMYNLLIPAYSNLGYSLILEPSLVHLEEARQALYKAWEYSILSEAYEPFPEAEK